MSKLPDWTFLEKQGLIQASPGREEAVRAVHEKTARKAAAKKQAMLDKAKPRTNTRKAK